MYILNPDTYKYHRKDSTINVKRVKNEIVRQIIDSIEFIGNNNAHIEVSQLTADGNNIYISMDIEYVHDSKYISSINGIVEMDFIRVEKINNRIEKYNGMIVHTSLYNSNELSEMATKKLNE